MKILVDFNDVSQRLADFESADFKQRYQDSPVLRGLTYALIALGWEGTPLILSDAFVPEVKDRLSFHSTLTRLGYQVVEKSGVSLRDIEVMPSPCFVEINQLKAIYLGVSEGRLILFDYANEHLLEYEVSDEPYELVFVSEYSRLFREPPPESQDKSNWVKQVFYRYHGELKALVILSFVISLLGAMQPFFIMSVYNFALSSGSESTLYWLTAFSVLLVFAEFLFKRMRIHIISTSGKDLAVHISNHVVAKLLWLPYTMTSNAGVSAQLARLKDIDTFRRLVTAESTLSYFDMPFVMVFILAIAIMSGKAALVVMAGLVLMLIFCVYSRYIYTQAISKSSRANAMVSYQWNEILRGIEVIQGLPLIRVIQSRFRASHQQSVEDAERVSTTNGRVQHIGGALIQAIGTASIVTAVLGVLDGSSNAGAMLATVILVWKALGPIMGIYNSISKFQSIKNSALQINKLMSLSDDKTLLEKSPPIRQFDGGISAIGLSHRYLGAFVGLTNLGFSIAPMSKVVISGPSGSGKTTLMSLLAGIEARYQGSLYVDGYNLKQFNNYRYRSAINYIPSHLHIFDGSLESNFILHNGVIDQERMQAMIDFFDLSSWLPEGIETQLTQDKVNQLPSGVQQKLRLALGLADHSANLIFIDEPFLGSEQEHHKYLNSLFIHLLAHKTVVFSSNAPSLISCSTFSLVLAEDSTLKYFGSTDKYLNSLSLNK